MIVITCHKVVLGVTGRILSLEYNHIAGEAWHLLMKDDCPYVLCGFVPVCISTAHLPGCVWKLSCDAVYGNISHWTELWSFWSECHNMQSERTKYWAMNAVDLICIGSVTSVCPLSKLCTLGSRQHLRHFSIILYCRLQLGMKKFSKVFRAQLQTFLFALAFSLHCLTCR